ncbi:hypothetical protein [Nocardia nova]|uniref:hypothetical protein n=1 Tax=Nocardia nova TaxID=37330 RepID=UPI0033F9BBFD
MSLAAHILELSSAAPPYKSPIGAHIVLAQDTEVSTGGLRKWIEDNIVFTILILIACAVLLGSLRGNLSRVLTVGGLSMVALAYLAIATSANAAQGIGNFLLGLLGIHTS